MSNKNVGKQKVSIKQRILTEEDFIHFGRGKNSISFVITKYPDGVEAPVIAKMLMLSEKEVDSIYQSALQKLKKALK